MKQNWKVALTANSTASSFASLIPTVTEPLVGSGIIEVLDDNDTLEVSPFGAGADDSTFSMRVIGWRPVGFTRAAAPPILWVPHVIAELLCTLSTAVGVAAASVIETDRFADTITLASGGLATLNSPTGNVIGRAIIDIYGFHKIQFSFDMTGATNGNALYTQCKSVGGAR